MSDKKFMFIYHGGDKPPPATEEEGKAEMARWQQWMDGIGDKLTDPGAPAGKSHTVSQTGVAANGGANPVMGYSLVMASGIDEAIEMARGCPLVSDGGSVEVAEAMEM